MLLEATSSPDPQLRANAIEALGEAPTRLAAVLPVALGDRNEGVRSVAAMMVGMSRMGELTPSVQPLLRDPSPYVRASAIFALERCGVGGGVDPTPLASMLLNDPSPHVRAHAAFILGELGDRSAVAMLRQCARDEMPRASQAEVRVMRLQLAEAMTKLGDNDQLHVIRAALYPSRPDDLETTALAAQIIGEVGDRGSIDELIYLSARWDQDKRPMPAEVRLAAAGSLAKLGLKQGAFIAREYWRSDNPAQRAQAAYVLGRTGNEKNLGTLAQMMEDEAGIVRVSAAAAIVTIVGAGG
jgi:HEAT repeat protein